MMDRKAEPEIRFKGFTDSWEQRKLSSLFDKFDDGDWIEAKDQSDSGVRLIQTGNVGITEFIDKPDNKKWISEDTFERLHCEEIFPGDILISRLPEPAGRACIVPDTGTRMITAVDCTIAHSSSENSAEFIVQYLSSSDYFKWVNTCLAGGTRQRISRRMLSGCDVMIPPTLAEQKCVGVYFSNLDNLITLHQRKCDKLCDFKKALLCNMFPAAEADAPKVRFKGYTKPWKHWTLGELYTERKEAGNDDLPILSVSIHSGVSADELDSAELGKAVRRSEDKSLYKHTYKGDLVFNMMRAWQGAIGVVPKEGMVSPAYITAIPNDEVFPEFMDYCLRREEVINQINNLSYGVTDFRKRLYWDSFVRVQIMLPSVEEQKKITATLVQLDELIELQSAKVERLKNLKAACLEKMFV
jgi:type I restriction enzyme S subunit